MVWLTENKKLEKETSFFKTTRLDEEARWVGLKINKEKTKAMKINTKDQEKIIINGQDIEDDDEFVYLGAKVCREGGGITEDLKNRLSKARGAFNKLKEDLDL